VVNEEASADPRTGMNFHAGQEAVQLGDESRQERDANLPKKTREAVEENGVESCIAEKDFQPVVGGGVIFAYRPQIRQNGSQHSVPLQKNLAAVNPILTKNTDIRQDCQAKRWTSRVGIDFA
jgi:hypothetical protein